MPRYRFKRSVFDGQRLWDANEPADIVDVFQPPRDAEVWDGDQFVPVPMKGKEVDMDELVLVAGDVPKEEETGLPDLSIPRKRGKK